MITGSEPKLEYFISEKNGYLVLSFVGDLTKATIGVCEKALLEISRLKPRFIVLNFHDLTRLDVSGIPTLVRMQKSLRERPAELRLCFMKPDIRKMMTEAGALRPAEFVSTLVDALRSFSA